MLAEACMQKRETAASFRFHATRYNYVITWSHARGGGGGGGGDCDKESDSWRFEVAASLQYQLYHRWALSAPGTPPPPPPPPPPQSIHEHSLPKETRPYSRFLSKRVGNARPCRFGGGQVIVPFHQSKLMLKIESV